jgi:sterol desaturase/sphingolipid hydroxylase (fatty acid hydroxylase superfamily)
LETSRYMTAKAISTGWGPNRFLVGVSAFATLFALAVGLLFVQRLATTPVADQAKAAVWALVGGNIAVEQLQYLGIYAAALLFPSLVLLAGCSLIERLVADERPPRASDHFIWVVQFVFAVSVLAASALISMANLAPDPLVQLEPRSDSYGDWALYMLAYLPALLLWEIGYYWLHRAQHHFPWLWKFHAVHHSQHDLDVAHGLTHPFEHVTRIVLGSMVLGFLVRFDLTALYLFVALIALQSKTAHMRAPIHFGRLGGILLADNRYHFIHHSRDPADFNTNFSDRFPFIDMMFGTYRAPRPVLPQTGLLDRAPPATLAQYMLAICPEQRGGDRS